MIPRSAITHWNKQVPWEDIANVEQDLIITRALTDRLDLPLIKLELLSLPANNNHHKE